MLTILLIPSGTTEYECQGRIQGTLDVPLSQDGRQQVEQLTQQLSEQPIDALYAGPGRATRQTADILAKPLHLKPKTIDKLHNLDQGLWQGMLISDVKIKQPKVYRQWQEHPETVCPPNGETLQEARERLQQTLVKMAKKHKSGTVALVVAEPLIRVLRNILRDDALGDLWCVESAKQPRWELIAMPAGVISP